MDSLDTEQERILKDSRDNLFNALTETLSAAETIAILTDASKIAHEVLPPYITQVLVQTLSDVATALRNGATLANDTPTKVAEEILSLHKSTK